MEEKRVKKSEIEDKKYRRKITEKNKEK